MSNKRLTIGLIVPANNWGGPQKLAAICANDLLRLGHRVELFIPRLPYFYYFVTLKRNLKQWLQYARFHVTAYLKDRSFIFSHILQAGSAREKLHVHNVLRRPSKRQLSRIDYLLVMTIAQVAELKGVYPQEQMIYQIHHPEELVHDHAETIRRIRTCFRGKIIAISPWTARSVSDHIDEPPVVPDVISDIFWERRCLGGFGNRDKDILFHYSTGQHKGGKTGESLIKAIKNLRPDTSVTVWTRDDLPASIDEPIIKNISEQELLKQYCSHK